MSILDISFGDGSLGEIKDKNPKGGTIVKFAGLDDGTTGGNPSIAILIQTNDGEYVVAELTYRLWSAANAAYAGRWGTTI
jgi:hypothetical protein